MPVDLRWNVYKYSQQEGSLVAEGVTAEEAVHIASKEHESKGLGEAVVLTPMDAAIFCEMPSLEVR